MADTAYGLPWTEAQWKTVNDTIAEEFAKASVIANCLPHYGPLAPSAEAVRDERIAISGSTVAVSDDDTVRLLKLEVTVELSNQQVADDALASAFLAFRRAANILALDSDFVTLNGYATSRAASLPGRYGTAFVNRQPSLPRIATASGPEYMRGLLTNTVRKRTAGSLGGDLVTGVANAVANLERNSYPRPFACLLGQSLFVRAQQPDASSSGVTPAERIIAMLDGNERMLLRSGQIQNSNVGVVISLAAGGVDVVVGTPPKAQFLQVTSTARFVFRVYTRFVLRIKEPTNPPIEAIIMPQQAGGRGRQTRRAP